MNKIVLNVTKEEHISALEIALYISRKNAFEDWLYKTHGGGNKINRQILQAYTDMYNQMYKYSNYMTKPTIKGISKKIKLKGGE